VVLGDDVVIANSTLAQAYRDALTGLGVTISEPKSVVPEKSLVADSAAEFAKRLLISGKDITPLPLEVFHEVYYLHQWWKVLDIIKELCRQDGIDIRITKDNIYVSPLVHQLLKVLPKTLRDQVLTLLSNVWTVELPFRENEGDDSPNSNIGFHTYPNPWAKTDTLSFLHYWGEITAEGLLKESNKLNNLKESLKEGVAADTCAAGLYLENQYHPVHTVLKRLDAALWSCYTTVTRGEQDPNSVTLMMDADALVATLTHRKGYRDWLRSKDRRQKLVQTLSIKVLKRLSAPAPTGDTDYSWY
jgi:hypothetical protein